MKHRITGIRRENIFSPNRIGDDAAIFDRVSELLRQKGCDVTEYEEAEFRNETAGDGLVFTMARDIRTLRKLQLLEDEGRVVVNSAYGVENCSREKMTRLLIDNNIPHPKSRIFPVAEADIDLSIIGSGCWMKRGDCHAVCREDVTFVRSAEEVVAVIREYARRNIPSIVVNEHLEGDLIKFYGVAGTDFFYWFYPDCLNYSKFGLEIVNGKRQNIRFDISALKTLCARTAQVLNVSVYGGDIVISSDGTMRIIDWNDWPSFAPCLERAAPFIAQHIYSQL
ncbi:MAG: hypothetical protein LBH19_11950 [Dysgonamonadaceae bacterium]|jgi:hypothetical protein|nr:hypothetical protein [Dysgonamonadaceae bacterium]